MGSASASWQITSRRHRGLRPDTDRRAGDDDLGVPQLEAGQNINLNPAKRRRGIPLKPKLQITSTRARPHFGLA